MRNFTPKQFQNIISKVWLDTRLPEVRKYIEAVKYDIEVKDYSRKDQRNVLSRLYLKESDSKLRDIIYEAQEILMDEEMSEQKFYDAFKN